MKYIAIILLSIVSLSCDVIAEEDVLEQILITDDGNSTPDSYPKRKVFIEYFTGHQCGNCPEKGANRLKELKTAFGDNILSIGIHTGFFARFNTEATKYFTDFSTAVGDAIENDYKIAVQGTPVGMVNRIEEGNTRAVSPGEWSSKVQAILADSVPFILSNDLVDKQSDRIDFTLRVKALENISGYNLVVYLVEDEITDWQKDYALEDEDVSDYVHNFVLRNEFNSSTPLLVEKDSEVRHTFSVDNNTKYQQDKLYAFVLVIDNEEILQIQKFLL